MDASIVDFHANTPHWSGEAQCRRDPTHKWAAVVPLSGNPWLLECPTCHRMSGFIEVYVLAGSTYPKKWADEIADHLDEARAALAARDARIAELEKALRPLATAWRGVYPPCVGRDEVREAHRVLGREVRP